MSQSWRAQSPWASRVLKWVRRRQALAALIVVSTAAAVTLVGVVLANNVRLQHERDVASALEKKAEKERRRAVAYLREARNTVDQLLTRFAFEQLDGVPYMEKVRLELLKHASRVYEGFAQLESDDPELRLEEVRARRRLGKVYEMLGDSKEAEQAFRSAAAIAKKLQAESPTDEVVLGELAACENNVGSILLIKKVVDAEAHERIVRALEIQEKLGAAHPESTEFVQNLAETYDALGRWFVSSGQSKQGEDALRRSISMLESVVSGAPNLDASHISLANRRRNLGVFLARQGRLKESEPLFKEDLQFWEKLAEKSPDVPRFQAHAADAGFHLNRLYADAGHLKDGEALIRRAVERWQRLVDEYPKVPGYHADLAKGQEWQARLLRDNKKHREACSQFEKAIAHLETCNTMKALNSNQRDSLASLNWLLADSQLELGNYQTAADLAEKLPKICPDRWKECYQATRLLTRCVTSCQNDKQPSKSLQRDNIEIFSPRSSRACEAFRRGCPELAFMKTDWASMCSGPGTISSN